MNASVPDRGTSTADQALHEALGLAYRYLDPRARTVTQVRGHLRGHGVAAGLVDACVWELCDQGYLDDARFAACFAEDRRQLDGWGPERIGARLRALGVEPDLVERALGGRTAEQELACAVEVLRRRLRCAPSSERERQRALGLLVRRGYELELAYDAVRCFEQQLA